MRNIKFHVKQHKRFWISEYSKIKIPLPPIEVQKEIVALMEKCSKLATQVKEQSHIQDEFSKSSMYFLTQSKNKKESTYYWKILKNNFKETLYSKNGVKDFKTLVFNLCLNGIINLQKLSYDKTKQSVHIRRNSSDISEKRIKKFLQTLIKEQKQYLKKEGVVFEEQSDSIWPMVELGEVCVVVGGGTPSTSTSLYWNGKIPWITPKDLSNCSNMYISKGQKHITELGLKKSSAKIVPENTILLSTRAPIGYVAIAQNPLSTNQGFRNLVLNKKCSPEYIYYILKSKTKSLNSLGSGATFKELSGGKLKRIKIPLPPIEVQKRIVALMDFIENIRRQIEKEKNLSCQLAQSLSHFEKTHFH